MDKDGAEDLVKRPQYTKAASIINITIVSIEGMAIPKEFKNLDVARCADVRLVVPVYLKEERIMYFDVDTLMTGPIVPALAQVMTEHAEQALFIAEEVNSENCSPGADGDLHCSWYNRHVSNGPRMYGKTGLNAGIVGINGRRWRELDFDRLHTFEPIKTSSTHWRWTTVCRCCPASSTCGPTADAIGTESTFSL